ncbi:MAG TPA: DUF3043 domain-containing protein [Microbacteriaceae bacterium]|nr:DUF3043 domain-containing protein [Microbacteriaceae bacterium]
MARRQTPGVRTEGVPDDGHQEASEEARQPAAGKGRATPSRREREAANKRPLVPADRRQAAKDARVRSRELRQQARSGMAAGEERYLTARDRGPQRRFVRDYVDARRNVAELMIPAMIIIIVLSTIKITAVQLVSTFALWAYFTVAIIDSFLLSRRIVRRLGERFGESHVQRGVRWYGIMRAMQLRVIRLPKPQVRRGQYPR